MSLYDENLREKVKKLPTKPGVYQYLDSTGKIIYVGKAKNLKNRVSSYLNKTNQSSKTLMLVSKVSDFRFIVVDSEQDAFLLENNLIKKYKPRYNILLKDDKTYPWICVKNEYFPRVFLTRKIVRDGSDYFGPYTSVHFADVLMTLIKSLYKLRTCNFNLSPDLIKKGKYSVCLEKHIGNCLAPCIGTISVEDYDDFIAHIKSILKGNVSDVIDCLQKEMECSSQRMEFEKANEIKTEILKLRNFQTKSTIVSPFLTELDVYSYLDDGSSVFVNFLRIVRGAINQVYTLVLDKRLDEEKESILSFSIFEIRQMMNSDSKELVVPFLPDVQLPGLQYVVPKIGDKLKLLELSEKNAAYYKLERDRQKSIIHNDKKFDLLKEIKNDLKLPSLPQRIECFDNSNIQGTNPVASCVVFLEGRPAKGEYRKFHVKTVVGPDDFASMEEIIYRRYRRQLDEGKPLPDLIVVDGGKGQLHAAVGILEKLGLLEKVPIVGLAKRMEEVYFPGDHEPLILAKNSSTLRTLMHIRDEAHRFGITFHRRLREKKLTKSELNLISGIGDKSVTRLVTQFKSIEEIRIASEIQLATAVGLKKAKLIFSYFHSNVQ